MQVKDAQKAVYHIFKGLYVVWGVPEIKGCLNNGDIVTCKLG